MGLLSFVFDALLLSSGAAGVRRYTGISLATILDNRIAHPTAKLFLAKYFQAGEVVIDSIGSLVDKNNKKLTGKSLDDDLPKNLSDKNDKK
eukprot:CAMPEP_0184349100 /NCGR_PEP_ID=MMETSP1089-20130417/32171_1 /TAXON_ID=38269 ORGANISM="Gloeochaete wittrockiana, Strain SAG46.84" /NCGR_SAMPLE_ID=MMETSP1089 /ASSEMBLY_ACC=CAM_ASM_000445 /LENGTH=90 /DNA_ID=CAMNT_0026681165 /DNA_START=61 /DNA_END=333 /DNA_ORIENTATION=-